MEMTRVDEVLRTPWPVTLPFLLSTVVTGVCYHPRLPFSFLANEYSPSYVRTVADSSVGK